MLDCTTVVCSVRCESISAFSWLSWVASSIWNRNFGCFLVAANWMAPTGGCLMQPAPCNSQLLIDSGLTSVSEVAFQLQSVPSDRLQLANISEKVMNTCIWQNAATLVRHLQSTPFDKGSLFINKSRPCALPSTANQTNQNEFQKHKNF